MSDIRTFKASGTEAYTSLLGLIEENAAECGELLRASLPPAYRSRRFSVCQTVALTESRAQIPGRHPDDMIVVYGWTLLSVPFFISDPRSGDAAKVFALGSSYVSEVVDRTYLQRRGPNARQWPTATQLGTVYNELMRIKHPDE